MAAKQLNNSFPLLVVRNLRKTVSWYSSRLGFKVTFADYKHADYASMQRDDIHLMFHGQKSLDDRRYAARASAQAKKGTGVLLYAQVPDVNKLHAEFKRRKAKIYWKLKDQEWGARTFTVEDPDGYLLSFWTPLPGHGHDCGEEHKH
jgi:uncharacterized glyoxalase superfamily protein PhnB